MKEYLLKTEDGTYHYHNENHDVCPVYVEKIEIPEGATLAAKAEKGKDLLFFKDLETSFQNNAWLSFINGSFTLNMYLAIHNVLLVWQRAQHPEELPFVDDEPKTKIGELYVDLKVNVDVDDEVIAFLDSFIEDTVNHPPHYASSSIECIDAMQAMLTPEQFVGYLRGNIFKYQWRYENKGGIQDLEKSQWYLKRLLSVLQS